MREFSISEAALVGFRLTRERPRAIAAWALLSLVFNFATLFVLVGVGGEAIGALQRTSEEAAAQDANAVVALLGQAAPAYGLVLLMGLAFSAVMSAAAARAVLRPQDEALGYLRFGADEVRVLLALLIIGVMLVFAYIGASMVAALALGVVLGASGAGASPATAASAVFVLVPFVLLALLWLWTRLSLAVPMTLAQGRVNVFGSWALTKGRSGKMFLTYLTAFALYMLVAILGVAIFLGLGAALSGSSGPMDAVMQPDMSSIGAYFNPLTVTYTVVMSVIGALGSAIVLCPPAVVYAALAGEDVHEVF